MTISLRGPLETLPDTESENVQLAQDVTQIDFHHGREASEMVGVAALIAPEVSRICHKRFPADPNAPMPTLPA